MINRFHGGDIWRHFKSGKNRILDFSVNVNPLGITEKIKTDLINNIDKIGCYPDPESVYLKNCLAEFYGLAGNNFLIGNGSIELIHLIPRALKAKVVLMPVPAFSEYEFAARANNCGCIFVKSSQRNNFKIDLAPLIQLIPKADLVFLCNPNNPTGAAITRQEILSLVKACKDKMVTLVIDEAFMDFVPRDKEITMISECVKNKYLLVLRSLTKYFVLPGLRIGYLVGHKEVIRKLSRRMYPWNVNTLAQVIAEKVIGDKEYIEQTKNVILEERAYLFDNLEKIGGIKVYPSDANFFLCKLVNSAVKDSAELSVRLLGKGILIRNCGNFRGLNDRFFRIAVKTRAENIKLLSALRVLSRRSKTAVFTPRMKSGFRPKGAGQREPRALARGAPLR